MIRLTLLAVTLLSTSAFAADRNFDRTVSAGNNPNVAIATNSGYVHLHPGNDTQVHVVAHLHAEQGGWFSGNRGDVEQRLNQIANNPPVQQNGNDIVIGERQNRDLYRNIGIDYDVTVPRGSSVNAFSGSGDIESQDVGQAMKAETGSGSVRVRGLHGAASLHSGSGDIELDETAQGDVKADTGSGSIRLRGVNGGVQAQSGSGDITIDGRPATDWRLQTGSGSIHLNLAQDARFNVNVTTGSGSINVRQSLSSSSRENGHHLTGSVNGGGPVLRASTGSGDIEIR